MSDDPPFSGKGAYEARRQAQREIRIRQGLPRPSDTARRLPAGVLWTILAVGWIVAFGEALAVGLGISWDWTPKLTIEAQANHFPNNPLGTEFRVSNRGRVSLNNLHFECVINKSPIQSRVKDFYITDSTGLEPLPDLPPDGDVTRNCGAQILSVPAATTIDFNVSYRWIFNDSPISITKHFILKRGQSGEFYAVPDYPGLQN